MIKLNRSPLNKWPEEWRDELIETTKQCYDLIGRSHFSSRFYKIASMRECYFNLDPIRERHPIELGFFLLFEEPDSLKYLAPGNFSWAYSFSRLFIKLEKTASASHWKDITTKVIDGLKPIFGTEEGSLNAIFQHMRLYDYLRRMRDEKRREDYKVLAGHDVGINSDVAIVRDKEIYGVDSKSLRQGWSRSSWDYLLMKSLQDSPSLAKFAKSGSGYVLITLPGLDFFNKTGSLKRLDALSKFEQAMSSALEGRVNNQEVFKDVKTGPLTEPTDKNARDLIDRNLPSGYGKYTYRFRFPTPPEFLRRNDVVLCLYYKNNVGTFEKRLTANAEKCMCQAGDNNRAVLAIDFDFFSAWQVRTKAEHAEFEMMICKSIETVMSLLKGNQKTKNIFGFFHSHDKPVNSILGLSSTQPLTDIVFFANLDSTFANGFQPALDRSKIYDW